MESRYAAEELALRFSRSGSLERDDAEAASLYRWGGAEHDQQKGRRADPPPIFPVARRTEYP